MICNLVTIPALSGVRSVSEERNRGALFRTISIEKLFFDYARKPRGSAQNEDALCPTMFTSDCEG